LIGTSRFPVWDSLVGRAPAALPALYAALNGDDAVMRREAAFTLERISRERGPEAVKLTPGRHVNGMAGAR